MGDADVRVQQAANVDALGQDVRVVVNANGHRLPVVRTELAERLMETLSEGQSVLLVGPSGVGKTELARSLGLTVWPDGSSGQMRLVNEFLGAGSPTGPRIVETQPARFLDGCYYASHLEIKMGMLMASVRERGAILFIDGTEQCVGAGSSSEDPDGNLANLLLPYMETRSVRVLGATTPAGLSKMRSRNPRFVSRFEIVNVPEPDEEEARAIIERHLQRLSRRSIVIADGILDAGLEVVRRYCPGGVAFSTFLRLIDRAATSGHVVDLPVLRSTLAADIGLLPQFVGTGGVSTHADYKRALDSVVFGQPRATSEVADALLRFAVGLGEPGRPIATFLAVGPSGTGKTALSAAISRVLTGSESNLVRFDMSEYSDPHAVARLIQESDHSLVGRLRDCRAGVLLLDEIEKAHHDVLQLLLQALGEARLTGVGGTTVRLDNFVVMMTSNVASSRWSGRHENHEEDRIQRTVLAACVDMFAPEFRGRLTSTLLFRPLSPETSERIVVRELDALNAQSGLVERGLQAMWADDVPARVAQVGMSPSHGGRGIQRAVRGMVATPLAHWLAEKPSARDGIVHMAFTGGHGKVGSAVIDFLASGAPCPDAVMWN